MNITHPSSICSGLLKPEYMKPDQRPSSSRKLLASALSALTMVLPLILACLTAIFPAALQGAPDYYIEPQIYGMRPNPNGESEMGPIGATGIEARIYKGVKVTVEEVHPDTPAFGKFSKGDVILGVNGAMVQGKDPLVLLGNALTDAEAKDGTLTFDVQPATAGKPMQVTVKVPVMGAYSATFPLNCAKSKIIVRRAAELYSGKDRMKGHGFLNGLACLFLLSTGDDQYVPRVKEYFSQFLNADGSVTGIGDMTWDNGYNGVACAEYYLRTGDRSVLPILQHYCNDAKRRQVYNVGWTHWGTGISPSYEAGGGMLHSAGNQVLLTLVLGKVCGANVDEKTLLGALTHWYRYAGRGAIPVADQRSWYTFRSGGRDGASAAVMHVASGAKGDTTIYRKAKEAFAFSSLTSWPSREYVWELYWESLTNCYMLEYDANLYHQTQQRFRWQYDLYRQASGAFSFPSSHDSLPSTDAGISLALAFTAPLKTLHITGAPRSKHAVDFSLPEHLWGTALDLAFHSSKPNKDFGKYGKEEEIHIPFRQLPIRLVYEPDDVREIPLETLLRNVHHTSFQVRAAAAKGLAMTRRFSELEQLLRDPDPRLRRAALDGINDYHAWFLEPAVGRHALKPGDFTPAMKDEINQIMSDPGESWFVIDGALQALHHAPVELIKVNIPAILHWTKNEDWWLRESAFMALMGLQDDEQLFVEYLPVLIDVMTREGHYNPRVHMLNQLRSALEKWKNDSAPGKLIVAGLTKATMDTEVLPDVGEVKRSLEGTSNIVEVALACISVAPEASADLAEAIAGSGKLALLDTPNLMQMVRAPDGIVSDRFIGLLPALATLTPEQKQRLSRVLSDAFLPELIKRYNSTKDFGDGTLIDMIIDLTRLKKQVAGWQEVGSPSPKERVWHYRAFDPLTEKDKLHPREEKRLREVELPPGLANWHDPGFDVSQWQSGRSPIGVGDYKAWKYGLMWSATPDRTIANNSAWGTGEFLMMRTNFEVRDLDHDCYRISILANQGYHIYLNGKKIHTFPFFEFYPKYNRIMLDKNDAKHLKKGSNTLAVFSCVRYEEDPKADQQYHPIGQMDLFVEGLRMKEISLAR